MIFDSVHSGSLDFRLIHAMGDDGGGGDDGSGDGGGGDGGGGDGVSGDGVSGDGGGGDGGGGDGVSGCGVLLYWVSGITSTSEDRFTLAREPGVSPRTCCNLGTRLSKRPSYQSGSQVVASLSVSSSSSIRDPTIEPTSQISHAHLLGPSGSL